MARASVRRALNTASGSLFGVSLPSPKPPQGTLTPHQWEVARLVAAGYQNKQAATVLGVSLSTVKAHLQRSYRRLGIFSRTELAVWVERNDDEAR